MFKSGIKRLRFADALPSGWTDASTKPFELTLPIEQGYLKRESSKPKILIVLEHVATQDLREGALFSNDATRDIIAKLMYAAQDYAGDNSDNTAGLEEASYAAINFNYFKTYHLEGDRYNSALKHAAKRVKKFIAKTKPDWVLVFGDEAAASLLPYVENVSNKRGWVHPLYVKFGEVEHKCKMVSTISPSDEILKFFSEDDDDGDYDGAIDAANLAGYIVRTISSMYAGGLCYDLSDIKPRAINITTMEKFDQLMRKIDQAPFVGVDLETTGLDVHGNFILTIQFALTSEKGYIVALHHKDSVFTAKELVKIKARLRQFFAQKIEYTGKTTRYLIGQGLKFDLRVLRQELKIPHIYWPVYDTLSGEYLLDENVKGLRRYNTSIYGLDAMFCSYGNDYYYTAKFSKQHRATITQTDLVEVLDYGAMDVQSVIAIHEQQQKRAGNLPFGKKNYLPYFKRFQLTQMSNTIHVMSVMEQRGILLDAEYLMELLEKDSIVNKAVDEIKAQFKMLPSVKKANELLLKNMDVPSKGLFGTSDVWAFDITKPAHKQILYFQVLKLKPVFYGKSVDSNGDAVPKIDKNFQKKYADVPEVKMLTELSQVQKLISSYVKAFYKHISQSNDGKKDGRLRPGYGFQDVVTGRSNSFKPSLQQIPQHSKVAKLIKRMFVAPKGKLILKMDYSAHEVRCWGLVSKDKAIANAFQSGKNLRIAYRKDPTPENKKEVELKGDIHKVNYTSFTGVPTADVTPEQRQESKGITFGSIYGMSPRTLASNLKKDLKYVEGVLDRFFSKFSNASAWLGWVKEYSSKRFYAYSPLGRRRNLWGYIYGVPFVDGALKRRAANSPIQGIASDFGFIAAALLQAVLYEFLIDIGYIDAGHQDGTLPVGVNVMVHDSIEVEAPYELVPMVLHIMEYCATEGVRKYVKQVYNMDFNVGLEVEFEIGAIADQMNDWDYSPASFENAIKKSIDSQNLCLNHGVDIEQTYKAMIKKAKKHTAYLEEKFPLDMEIK